MPPKTVTLITIVLLLQIISPIHCVPVSPCPMIFHYEFDGQNWLGVAKIYPQIYNRFRTDKITINLSLALNHIISNANFRLLELYKSLVDTYQDIAARRPIMYRISFPTGDEVPRLLLIQVNDVPVCTNHLIFFIMSKIDLKHTLPLPTIDTDNDEEDDSFDIETDSDNDQDHDNGDFGLIPNVPEVIVHRVNKDKNQKVNNLLSTVNNQCGKYEDGLQYTQLISGGQKVAPGTWPWLVAIFRKDSRANNLAFQCSGNLITNRLILTAAHCFKMDARLKPSPAKEFLLAFGRHDIRDWTESNSIISDIEQIILHEDYLNKKQANFFDADIAIVISKKIINYNTMIRPICLWPVKSEQSTSLIGTNGTLVGWGQPIENSETNTPRKLILPVVRNQNCFPSGKGGQGRRVFCTGSQKVGYAPCNGDSGNGFAIHLNGAWYLRGIVSAALSDPILNKCELNTFVIFTDIIHFVSWIKSFM